MDAVRLMGEIIVATAEATKDKDFWDVQSLWYSAMRRMITVYGGSLPRRY